MTIRSCVLLLCLLVVPVSLRAQEKDVDLSAEATEFRAHVDWLASPFMKGRMPGTPEMEFARQYVEWHFQELGLEPAFGGSSEKTLAAGANSFRQPFEWGQIREMDAATIAIAGVELEAEKDYRGMLAGADGEAKGSLVFAGYGIRNIGSGYQGLTEEDDFSGKIAVIFGYAPMDENGKSLYEGVRGDWPREASIFLKSANFRRRNAAGVILVVPPGHAEEGGDDLDLLGDRSHVMWRSPVIAMTAAGLDRILAAGKSGETAMSLRRKADLGRAVIDLGTEAEIKVAVKSTPRMAENVGALLRGRGKLADEVIVVGAHIDHLGLGGRGSRAGPEGRGKVHPGADDNASGTAAIIMMARDLGRYYRENAEAEEGRRVEDLRSVLFLGFDAEEQGLIGSRHYVDHPITPLDKHAVMVNFDMIGRITDHQLKLDGADSATNLGALIRPLFDDCGLVIKEGSNVMMASDHAPFYSKNVPILFSIITPFHEEYHTPKDTADKMNGEDAVRVIHLYNRIVKKVAAHPEKFEFQRVEKAREGRN